MDTGSVNNMIDTHAGQTLRRERQQRGVAILALATVAGCSPTTVVAIERYGYRPSSSVRARIAAALGLDPDAIWTPDTRRS
jgi:transcriptional regulator with XRE-family HTH domain